MEAGYEETFVGDIDSRLTCPICLLVLRNAVQTACGHRFCETCLSKARSTGTTKISEISCPIDKIVTKTNQIFPDIATRREIMSLPVECRNLEKGCSWQGELRELEAHRIVCSQEPVNCPNQCQEMIKRDLLQEHLLHCPAREVECTHCSKRVVHSALESHLDECPKIPVECELCHAKNLLRDSLKEHKDPDVGTCPMTIVSCPFSYVGCLYSAERHKVREHATGSDALAEHMMLAARVIQEHSKTIKDLKEKVNRTSVRTDEIYPQVLNSQKRLVQLGREVRERNMSGRLQWKLKLRGYNHNDHGGHSRRSSTSYCSPAFYTGCPGYRVQLTLSMDGYRENGDAYASLSLGLLPGDYDDSIVFPFNATCNVILFDQTDARRSNYDQQIVVRQMQRNKGNAQASSNSFKREISKYMRRNELVGGRSKYVRNGFLHLEILVRQSVFPPPDSSCCTPTCTKTATPRRNTRGHQGADAIQGYSPHQIMGVALSTLM